MQWACKVKQNHGTQNTNTYKHSYTKYILRLHEFESTTQTFTHSLTHLPEHLTAAESRKRDEKHRNRDKKKKRRSKYQKRHQKKCEPKTGNSFFCECCFFFCICSFRSLFDCFKDFFFYLVSSCSVLLTFVLFFVSILVRFVSVRFDQFG